MSSNRLYHPYDLHHCPGQAHIGYATLDGVVGLVNISQILNDDRDPSQPAIPLEIIVTLDVNFGLVCDVNRLSVTALSWIETPDKGVSLFLLDSFLIHRLIHST